MAKSGRGGNGATIDDIAREAGVSKMTVSRALTGRGYVGEETRARIMAIAKKLHYTPNMAARRLARAENLKIGIFFRDGSGAYMSEFFVGVIDESLHKDVELVLERSELTPAALRAQAKRLKEDNLAGALLAVPMCDSPQLLASLKRAGVPTVSVGAGKASPDISCVRIDEFKAAYEMTQCLLSLGHRRLGFVKGTADVLASGARLQGFSAAIAEAGRRAAQPIIVAGDYRYRGGFAAGSKLLDMPDPPTAIFASNDDMAAGVVAAAQSKGLEAPGDLSVVGFDDSPIASAVWPDLTTVRQPIAQMAKIALQILLGEIRQRELGEPHVPVDRIVDHALVVRASSGPPRKRRS